MPATRVKRELYIQALKKQLADSKNMLAAILDANAELQRSLELSGDLRQTLCAQLAVRSPAPDFHNEKVLRSICACTSDNGIVYKSKRPDCKVAQHILCVVVAAISCCGGRLLLSLASLFALVVTAVVTAVG